MHSPSHYELRISITRMSVRLYERAGQPNVWITPNNYELCITNYELIQTPTSVRLYERTGQPNAWITQIIMNMNMHFYYTHVRAFLREDRFTKCVDYPQIIMNYAL